MTTKSRKAIDFHYAENAILAFLYTEFVNDRAIDFEIKALFDRIPRVSKNVLRVSIESLTTDGFLDKKEHTLTRPARSNRNTPLSMVMNLHASEEYQVDVFRISKHGISRVEEFSGEYYDKIVSDVTAEPQISSAPKASTIPTADQFVTLNDNQVAGATKHIEDFIKEFRQDHHFGNEWVAEKSALLKTLEAGKDYLENKVIDVRIGMMMTIEPLKEIVAKYDQVAVGGTISAMAQKLIEFLINLFAG